MASRQGVHQARSRLTPSCGGPWPASGRQTYRPSNQRPRHRRPRPPGCSWPQVRTSRSSRRSSATARSRSRATRTRICSKGSAGPRRRQRRRSSLGHTGAHRSMRTDWPADWPATGAHPLKGTTAPQSGELGWFFTAAWLTAEPPPGTPFTGPSGRCRHCLKGHRANGRRGGHHGEALGSIWCGHRTYALVVGLVSPALASSSGGSDSAKSDNADKQQTIRVVAVFTEFDPNIDLGAPGLSVGDEVVFSGDLLRNGEQVGRIGVVCTFVSMANAERVEAQCPTTSILPGGQITTQGTIVNRSLNFTLPITGGSGQYQGARGQVVSRE
jgi:hypothetical protein